MEDDAESSLVYDLTQSHKTCSVLSLKANSRLLKDLQAQDGQASIVFTSTTSARVTVGTEEYDLTFCDTKRTVSIITYVHMWILFCALFVTTLLFLFASDRMLTRKQKVVKWRCWARSRVDSK